MRSYGNKAAAREIWQSQSVLEALGEKNRFLIYAQSLEVVKIHLKV